MYPYVCKIRYYEDVDEKKLNLLLYASNFEEAAHFAEGYAYNIVSMEIYATGDEVQLFEVTDEVADNLIKNESVMQ